MKTTAEIVAKEWLERLARRLERRAVDINCANAWSNEERAVRRSMVVIYSEIAEMLRAESGKLSNDPS